MSSVVKCEYVAYDIEPRELNSIGKTVPKSNEDNIRAADIGFLLSRNAMESADVSLKSAIDKVKELKNQARIDMQIVLNDSIRTGSEYGYADGRNNGEKSGNEIGLQMVEKAAQEFTSKISALSIQTAESEASARKDCVDFAFGLAESILNINIDRNRAEYRAIFDEFISIESQEAVLSADGIEYPFKYIGNQSEESFSTCTDAVSVLIKTEENIKSKAEEFEPEQPQAYITPEETENPVIADVTDVCEPMKVSNSEIIEQSAAVEPVTYTEPENVEEQQQNYEPDNQNVKQTDLAEDVQEIYGTSSGNEEYLSEKFVFVNPVIRKARINSGTHSFKFEDITDSETGLLKQFLRKADPKLIAAAFAGSDDDILKTVLDACPRKLKEKITDGILYLGPVSDDETQKSRNDLTEAFTEFMRIAGGGE